MLKSRILSQEGLDKGGKSVAREIHLSSSGFRLRYGFGGPAPRTRRSLGVDGRPGACIHKFKVVDDVRFGAHSGPKPDITGLPKSARLGHAGSKLQQKKAAPRAALNSNPMVVDEAAINTGFDFRRYARSRQSR